MKRTFRFKTKTCENPQVLDPLKTTLLLPSEQAYSGAWHKPVSELSPYLLFQGHDCVDSEVATLAGVCDTHGPRQEQACSQNLQTTPETQGGAGRTHETVSTHPEPRAAHYLYATFRARGCLVGLFITA